MEEYRVSWGGGGGCEEIRWGECTKNTTRNFTNLYSSSNISKVMNPRHM
jgi:hypothetical protein